jgi:hypothetical protein|tara:strand:- start:37 stop:846 length:810 start_codon:yes stop_codon:yes gene_type:complete
MYVPKNRIKTNLYTAGDEFVVKTDKTEYTGFYHSLWTGRFFTGKTQNDKPTNELIRQSATMDSVWDRTTEEVEFQQYAENFDGIVYDGQYQDMQTVMDYNLLTETDISVTKIFPQQFYPTPSLEDYKLGSFTRYFAVKVNELIYLEINKKTYNLLKSQSNTINFEMYEYFKMQWTIEGVEENVFDINRDQVLIAQQNIQRLGFTNFLQDDYLKFYRSANINNQFTSGNDYALPSGLSYQGLYHIMPNGIAMTGKFHGEGEDILLTPLSN